MSEKEYKKFGNIVKKWRLKKKLTQEQLAYAAGISVTYMSKIENGYANASLDTILKLSKGLKIKVGELFEGM